MKLSRVLEKLAVKYDVRDFVRGIVTFSPQNKNIFNPNGDCVGKFCCLINEIDYSKAQVLLGNKSHKKKNSKTRKMSKNRSSSRRISK